ncbi:hypothetical protein RQP46_004156 [Phenoliferia psychrophenolica]
MHVILRSHGAAQALEDASVLTALFSNLRTKSQIPQALKIYQDVRKDRADRAVASATSLKSVLHLPDGPEQVKRDQAMREVANGGPNPDLWGNAQWQEEVFSCDIFEIALIRAKTELGGGLEGALSCKL